MCACKLVATIVFNVCRLMTMRMVIASTSIRRGEAIRKHMIQRAMFALLTNDPKFPESTWKKNAALNHLFFTTPRDLYKNRN
jgi:hypothetical protein